MELIDQLEPTKRGLYGGACGYISYAGDMDVAIAIRTGIVKDQMLHVQAAAGVVADSVPELEWKETEAKARALLRAAELVEEGPGMSKRTTRYPERLLARDHRRRRRGAARARHGARRKRLCGRIGDRARRARDRLHARRGAVGHLQGPLARARCTGRAS
jgi:hypothetical protein